MLYGCIGSESGRGSANKPFCDGTHRKIGLTGTDSNEKRTWPIVQTGG